IYAATNGFLDRLNADRVSEFLTGLTERLHAQSGDVRAKIAAGDWSDEVQKNVHDAVESFAEDFGYDLDEEGQPLDEDAVPPPPARPARPDADEEGAGEAEESEREETTAAA